jgi:hypothetical protein
VRDKPDSGSGSYPEESAVVSGAPLDEDDDDKRHGTTTLFAFLELAEVRIIPECMPRHRHQQWVRCFKTIDAQTPADLDLHLIDDNYATHKHPKVKSWLKGHPRFHMHFIPPPAHG